MSFYIVIITIIDVKVPRAEIINLETLSEQ